MIPNITQVKEKSIFWDADTYHDVSIIQENWADTIIQKRKWTGKENLLDAGCGSGRITKILSKIITEGKIYAIDNDPNMINKATESLKNIENVQVIQEDLLHIDSIDISIKFDVIFSNAVLHWILDHYRIFKNFYDLLNPKGELLIQCGGYGNLQETISVFNTVKDLPKFSKYFTEWKNDWKFAKPVETENILKMIGYKDIKVYLTEAPAKFDNKNDYSVYLKTVVLGPYLKYLPSEEMKFTFLDTVLSFMEKHHPNLCWKLDYVRLNISATSSIER